MKRFRALVWVLSPKVAFLYWCNFDALVQLIRLFLQRKCRKWRWRWPVITGCGKKYSQVVFKNLFHELLGKNFDTPRHIFVKKTERIFNPSQSKKWLAQNFYSFKIQILASCHKLRKVANEAKSFGSWAQWIFFNNNKYVREIFTMWGWEHSP